MHCQRFYNRNALEIRKKWIVSGQELIETFPREYGYYMYNLYIMALVLRCEC